MITTQTWVGYAARSYEVIKRSLLNRLGVIAPEISDHSEQNPFIILVSQFSGVAEVIHLYLDAIAREAFIGTARRYASVVKLSRLVDYSIKARISSTADLLFVLVDSNTQLPVVSTANILIPRGTLIYPLNSTVAFRSIRDTTLPIGYASVYVAVEQYTQVLSEIIGTTSSASAANQSFTLSNSYVHGSLKVVISGVTWSLYNSFALMGPTTKGVVVEIDENRQANLVFGDGVNGEIPPNTETIFIDYKTSEGASGNLPPQTITELQSIIATPTNTELTVNNPDYSSNGADFETIDEIRDRAPRSTRTLGRGVTYQDYVDLAMLVPGVGAAEVKYCCGKYVDVYVVPNSRGSATTALVNKVKQDMDCKVMITTKLDVKPAGNSRVYIKAKIIGKPLAAEGDIYNQVVNKWDEKFGYGTLEINRRVSITDIIAETEQLSLVDTLEIQEIRIEPYARPILNTTAILNIAFNLLPHTTLRMPYKLIYKQGLNEFQIYKNGGYLQNIAPGAPFTDGSLIGFTINVGVYTDNDTWEFTINPSFPEIFPETIIEVKDFSSPVIDIEPFINNETVRGIFGELTIEEQGSSSACMPSCS